MFYINGKGRYYRLKYETVSPDIHVFWQRRLGKRYRFKTENVNARGR